MLITWLHGSKHLLVPYSLYCGIKKTVSCGDLELGWTMTVCSNTIIYLNFIILSQSILHGEIMFTDTQMAGQTDMSEYSIAVMMNRNYNDSLIDHSYI